MKKKALALILTLVMAASMIVVPAAAVGNKTYPDAVGHWAEESILRWSRCGLVKGDEVGNVNPNKPLRRCEMAMILSDMLGLRATAPISTFRDIDGSEWYARAILRCAAAGIMEGSNSMCYPEDYITREETIVMFARALGVQANDAPDLSAFTDGDKVSGWAAPYMDTLVTLGILSGMGDGTIAPHDAINRAGAFTLMDKAISVYADAPGTYNSKNANGFVVVNANAHQDGDVIITGNATGVLVTAGAANPVRLRNLEADNVLVNGKGDVLVAEKSILGTMEVNQELNTTIEADAKVGTLAVKAENATVTNAGTVDKLTCGLVSTVTNSGTMGTLVADAVLDIVNTGTVDQLVANAAAMIDNTKGIVKNAEINIGGVVMDGSPQIMTLADGVARPSNSFGRPITASGAVSGGSRPSNSGGNNSGSNTKPATVAVTGVALDKAELELEVEGTATLTATVEPKNATNQKVTWSSDHSEIAAVDDKGKVTAVAEGEAVITVTTADVGKTAFCTIKVSPKGIEPDPGPDEPKTPSVTVEPKTVTLILKENENVTAQLDATVTNAEGATVTWSSNAENIATVDQEGTVTAKAVGTTTVTATITVDGTAYSDTCTVEVKKDEGGDPPTPEIKHTVTVADGITGGTVSVDPAAGEVDKGTTVTVTVTPNRQTVQDGKAIMPYICTDVTVTAGEGQPQSLTPTEGVYSFTADAEEATEYVVSATFVQPITEAELFIAKDKESLAKMLTYGYPENDVTAEQLAETPWLFLGLQSAEGYTGEKSKIKLTANETEVDLAKISWGQTLCNKWCSAYIEEANTDDPNKSPDVLGLTADESIEFVLTFEFRGASYTLTCTYDKSAGGELTPPEVTE